MSAEPKNEQTNSPGLEPWNPTFAEIFNPRSNSLSFLRFVFAILVIYSHSHPLTGIGTDKIFGHPTETWGLAAVYCFFALSGFLITRSFDHSVSVWVFLWHRFLRIYPGFIVCLIVTAFFFAPIVQLLETGSLENFWNTGDLSPLGYIVRNSLIEIKQEYINYLLGQRPVTASFNGSLWTLILEVKCYLMVAIIGVCGLLGKNRWFTLILFFAFLLVTQVVLIVPDASKILVPYFMTGWFLRMGTYFVAGMVFAKFAGFIPANWKLCAVSVILLVCTISTGGFNLFSPILIAYIVLYAGSRLPFPNFDRYGDWSYGIYIYAFPIQQILALIDFQRFGFFAYLAAVLLITLIFAALSFHFVEKPALTLRGFRIRKNQG